MGITRAQDRLTIYAWRLQRMKWGKARPTIPSRFLYEITGQAEKAPKRTDNRHSSAKKKAPTRPAARRPRGR